MNKHRVVMVSPQNLSTKCFVKLLSIKFRITYKIGFHFRKLSAKTNKKLPKMTPIHTKIPIFPWTPLLIHVRRHLGEPFRKFSAKIMTKFKVILQKLPKSAKYVKNLHIQDHKIQNFEFSHRYHYSYTLEDTQENILGSFQPKIMKKFEVILQKLQKCKKIDYMVRAGRPIS